MSAEEVPDYFPSEWADGFWRKEWEAMAKKVADARTEKADLALDLVWALDQALDEGDIVRIREHNLLLVPDVARLAMLANGEECAIPDDALLKEMPDGRRCWLIFDAAAWETSR